MKVLLVFPPISDPRAPHLAPACLAASLRRAGHEVTVKDLDLETLEAFLNADYLSGCLARAQDKKEEIEGEPTLTWRQSTYHHKLSRAIEMGRMVLPGIKLAFETLRGEDFYRLERHREARAILDGGLSLVATSHHPKWGYRLKDQLLETHYQVDRVEGLCRAVSDEEENLFLSWFERWIEHEVSPLRPDLVGISILNYQQVLPGLTLSFLLKKRGWLTVIGGTVLVKFIEPLRKSPRFFDLTDGVIVYEGEQALVGFCEALQQKKSWSEVPNLMWRKGKNVLVNEPFVVEDLEGLPTPDFDGLPLDRYLTPARVLPFNLGKGCYWNRCHFCEISYVNRLPGAECRLKSTALIADQLEELSQKYETPYFLFTDESCSPHVLSDLSSELIRRKADIRYAGYARFDKGFNEKVLKHLVQGGCRKLLFGLESGSEETLKAIEKGITVKGARQVLNNCAKAGMRFRVYAIIGFPNETEQQAAETLRFFQESAPLFQSPFNSFEINVFHLDRHSAYARCPNSFGIEKVGSEPGALSLGGWPFKTPGGMDRFTLGRLVKRVRDELYAPILGNYTYSAWEEYSLLLIDRLDRTEKEVTPP